MKIRHLEDNNITIFQQIIISVKREVIQQQQQLHLHPHPHPHVQLKQ